MMMMMMKFKPVLGLPLFSLVVGGIFNGQTISYAGKKSDFQERNLQS
jgi:hypothetical protein